MSDFYTYKKVIVWSFSLFILVSVLWIWIFQFSNTFYSQKDKKLSLEVSSISILNDFFQKKIMLFTSDTFFLSNILVNARMMKNYVYFSQRQFKELQDNEFLKRRIFYITLNKSKKVIK